MYRVRSFRARALELAASGLLALALAGPAGAAPASAWGPTLVADVPAGTQAALYVAVDGDEAPNPGRVTGSGFACTAAISFATEEVEEFSRENGCLHFYSSTAGSITLRAIPAPGFQLERWRSGLAACSTGESEPPASITIERSALRWRGFEESGRLPVCVAVFGEPEQPADPCTSARRLLADPACGDPPCPANATIVGTDEGESIEGTEGDDVICGLGGDDVVVGHGGVDRIFGGAGDDQIAGGAGHDFLLGGAGGDTLAGGPQDDDIDGGDGNEMLLLGGGGRDVIRDGDGGDGFGAYGCAGPDHLIGGAGPNVLLGDSPGVTSEELALAFGPTLQLPPTELDCEPADVGADVIDGGAGNDRLHGLAGADTIRGEAGDDRILGDAGNDTLLSGGAGSDKVTGGPGNDRIAGGTRFDILDGEAGNDTLLAHDGVRDTVKGGPGTDNATVDGNDTVSAVETVTPA